MKTVKRPTPEFAKLNEWESYPTQMPHEYMQSMDEGLDVEGYKDRFYEIYHMPEGEERHKLADEMYDVVLNAKMREDYKYNEPSDLESIKALRKPHKINGTKPENYKDKLMGAWMGRICGCLLGKPVECMRTNELVPMLKHSNNYPMHRYILSTDITEEMYENYEFSLKGKAFADTVDHMPMDDDTNYMVLAQKLIEQKGRDFTPEDVAHLWQRSQPKFFYCTAERVAYINFVNGFTPPNSAVYKNPFREWIGAQIRGDYFGYINPANPELAAEFAFRDASISHTKNGIYGEMWVSAMLAVAAVTDSIEDIIYGGLAQIPHTSRLYEAVESVINGYKNGTTEGECFERIHKEFDEYSDHGWTHTISNAMIVTAALLYGKGDYSRSICMAVETGFDTDCNGATVGSILGMRNGISAIDEAWTKPINNRLSTTIFGVGEVKISDCVDKTLEQTVWGEL